MILLIRFASCEGYCKPGIAGGQLGHPVESASKKKEAKKMENSLELRKRKIPEEIICIPESHHAWGRSASFLGKGANILPTSRSWLELNFCHMWLSCLLV